jgi:nicotinamidase-related amidase
MLGTRVGPIVYVRVGFSEDYSDQPKKSPLFGKADEFGALKLGTWATEFHESLDVQESDAIITKHRVSPFYGTNLDTILKKAHVANVYLAGVSTDLVVEAAARDAHDRDYQVHVLADCCVAANETDHENALATIKKIAEVGNLGELL